ncbi:class I SAM-dependent methyltransferase [Nocardioides sp. GXQ0305]|uniref:class I SAM-dependent methyltransferase n=1 Tax=Nocardioides sp. GXQ0305 TaxID=3423912 RepID=UPI003D7CDD4E
MNDTAEAVADRLLTSTLGLMDTLAVYLGDRLGWYRSLAADGPATAAELAERTGTNERYAREWLEQQAVAGWLEVTDGTDAAARRFTLPAAAEEVLTDPDSLNYLAPLPRLFAASAGALPELLAAYREGGGVSWERLGADAREGQADMNRPWYEQELAPALARAPEVHDRLSRDGAAIADVGCGAGWSTIALARAYPGATLHGLDVDEPSVAMARANAAEAGLDERVTFTTVDGNTLPEQSYDAVFAFECIHDMPRPVEVLRAARGSLVDDGFMVVMDEAVADEFAPGGDELERLMYGFSLFICLPDGLSGADSVGTGTVMRRDTLAAYATEAGFGSTDVLPTGEFGLWRFYLLRP